MKKALTGLILFVITMLLGCTSGKERLVATSASLTYTATRALTETTIPPAAIPKTPTPTAKQALSSEEAEREITVFFANNRGCSLPCIWGIMPGVTNADEATVLLSPFRSIANYKFSPSSKVGNLVYSHFENGIEIYSDFRYLGNDENIVNRLRLVIEGRKETALGYEYVFNNDVFDKYISFFTLSNLVKNLGAPSEVLILTTATPPSRGGQYGFYLVLLYPEREIVAQYSASWLSDNENVLGCMGNAHFKIELQPTESALSFSEFLSVTEWSGLWPSPEKNKHWKTIENAAQMSVLDFYDQIKNSDKFCVSTPKSIWPNSEP